MIIDEDSSGLDHERIFRKQSKMSNAQIPRLIEINEDQEVQSILSRVTAA